MVTEYGYFKKLLIYLMTDFPYKPFHIKVCRTVRFQKTGYVKGRDRSGGPQSATNEDKSLDVLQMFVEERTSSLKAAATQHVIKIFKF